MGKGLISTNDVICYLLFQIFVSYVGLGNGPRETKRESVDPFKGLKRVVITTEKFRLLFFIVDHLK